MVYDPVLQRADAAASAPAKAARPAYGLASSEDRHDPKVLPRRLLEDEAAERFYKLASPEFAAAFEKASARWLSRDCHRSQYGYPFRVAIELALENRHRSVTLATFACSGAEVAEGLFLDMDPRERASEIPGGKVRAQLDQLSDLLCRGARSLRATYTLPVYTHGSTRVSLQTVANAWCPPQSRMRPIDLVLMSIGGNDVGFGALAVYSLTEAITDLAPIAGLADLVGHSSRFSPQVSRVYLDVLDERMQAVKAALRDGFGVAPARVVQSSYEPIQHDETGALCGAQPTLGMDVHPGLRLSRLRLQETAHFLDDFFGRLECITGGSRPGCPAGLATGAGTGFRLVTSHIPEFARRGLCARDPKRALADGTAMACRASRRTATPSSPIRRRRRSPMPTAGACSARPTTPSSPPIPIAKARRCSTFSSPPMPGCTAARSTRRRKRMPSSPTTCSGTRAQWWTDMTRSGICSRAGRGRRRRRNYSRTSLDTGWPRAIRLNSPAVSPTRSRTHSSCPFTSTPEVASAALS
jgi:hypothetical protein